MLNILVTDGMDKTAVTQLKTIGYNVTEQFYESDILGEKLKNFDVVVIRSATKIRKEHIDIAKQGKLKLIIRAGVGIDNIDHEYAKNLGIDVQNTPNASSPSVAELALAHMFSLARFIPVAKTTMSNGEWNKKQYKGIELAGKTLGIIGMGRIGVELAKKADAFGMNVIYNDIKKSSFVSENVKFVEKDELLKASDFISLHLPKSEKPVIGSNELNLMKDSAYLINCARGGVVDETALIKALKDGSIAGLGIDVFEEEPTKNIELVSLPNVSVTPHIGAQTKEAQERVGLEVVTCIQNFDNMKEQRV